MIFLYVAAVPVGMAVGEFFDAMHNFNGAVLDFEVRSGPSHFAKLRFNTAEDRDGFAAFLRGWRPG